MDMDQIKSFCTVAKYKSFRKAGEVLNLSQPGVSRRIFSLEQEMGVTLFLRTPQSVVLTKQGADFLPYAVRILQVLEEGTEKTIRGKKEDKLILAGTPTICLKVLPEIIKEFRSQYNSSILLYTVPSEEVYDMLLDQTIHLGFSTSIFSNPLVQYEKILEEEICCIGHKNFVKQYIQDGKIIQYPIPVIYTILDTAPWGLINNYLFNSPYYEIVVQTHLTPVALKLAQQGVGLTIIPDSDEVEKLLGQELVKVPLVDFELPRRPLYMISHKEKILSEKEIVFMNLIWQMISENEANSPNS